MTYINLKKATQSLIKKSLYDFLLEMWDTFESAPYEDCWLTQYQCECFMYSVKHFLPNYITSFWIDDDKYAKLRRETSGGCAVRDKLYQGEHVHNHDWNMPPRHSKTSIIGVAGPCWLAINVPRAVATVSHNAKLSGETNEKRLKLFQSEKYRYYFGDEKSLKLHKASATDIKLLWGSHLYAVCQTSFTGFGADCVIGDDLISSDNAAKDMQVLKNVRSFFRQTLPTRLNTKKTGVIWQVQQRLAPGDISGMILSDPQLSKVYSHTQIQAIATYNQTFIYPCSGKVKEIKKGDLLWPSRFGDYTQIRLETGESVFQTQYQQNAISSDLTVIKESMIHFIDEGEDYELFKNTSEIPYASHDCPVKDSEKNDFHGFVSGWGRGNELIIDGGWEERMGYEKEKSLMISMQQATPALLQVVEDKANGGALLQDLRNEVPGLIEFNPGTNSKRQRLELASVYVQSGAVRFVKNAATEYLRNRLVEYPFLDHDDIIDAFSQLVLYHFTQRKNGVYTNSFTYQNLTVCKNYDERNLVYGITINGDLIKLCAIYINNNIYTVVKEWQMRGLETFADFYAKTFTNLPVLVDCSYKNSLSNLLSDPNIILVKYEDEDREKSIYALKVGFYRKKVLVDKTCAQTINDISKLRFSTNSVEQGKEVVDTFDEGLAGCVRGAIAYYRGNDSIWA